MVFLQRIDYQNTFVKEDSLLTQMYIPNQANIGVHFILMVQDALNFSTATENMQTVITMHFPSVYKTIQLFMYITTSHCKAIFHVFVDSTVYTILYIEHEEQI